MKFNKNSMLALIGGAVFGLSIGLTSGAFADRTSQNNQQELPLEDIQRFTTAISQVKSYYVEPVDDKVLFENAIRGMMSGLDPHSAYLDEKEFQALKDNTSGEFGGLGIEVTMDNGYIKVISPIDDTPASKAGLKPGDYIIRIDGKPVKGLSLQEAVNKMRGKKGSVIKLTIAREGETKPIHVDLTRDIIVIKSVKSEMLENGYAYVRISNFQEPSAKDLQTAIKKLQKESNGQLKGMILDLRNNPGGLLDSAVEVSDVFLDSDKLSENSLIVYTKGRLPGARYKAHATPGDQLSGAPVVVLINEGSASASEIVAGALQDHRRAIIMGTETFGKGSVQTVLPLTGNRGIKITTALYYTPNGRSIQADGIHPDIIVKTTQLDLVKEDGGPDFAALKEEDLMGHLAKQTNVDDATLQEVQQAKNSKLLKEDFQLYQALTLLKGMTVVQKAATP